MPTYPRVRAQADTVDGAAAIAAESTARAAAIAAQAATDSATYASINGASVTSPNGLRRWWSAFGRARTGFANIAVVGDSITVGAYANDTASSYTNATVEQLLATTGWVGQLRSRFSGVFGDVGEGFIGHNDFRAVASGGANLSSVVLGMHGSGTVLTSGTANVMTYTLPACTAFDICLWTPFGASAAAAYNIDGGSDVTIPASPGTSNTPYRVVVTGQANTTHTVVVKAPASGGSLYVYGVDVKSTATSGVRVHRIGRSGAKSTDALNIGTSAGGLGGTMPDRTYACVFGSTGTAADLIVVPIGTNDAASPQTPTPTAFSTNIQTLITWAAANGKCVLLVSEARRAVPNGLTYSEQDYYDQMRALALANDHVTYLDMQPAFGTYAQATTLTQMMADGIHPTGAGHGLIANTVWSLLTTPTRYPGT